VITKISLKSFTLLVLQAFPVYNSIAEPAKQKMTPERKSFLIVAD